jgi:cytochrome b6-f complex iron-sulfur subunit
MSSDPKLSRTPTRRSFLGWWIGTLLAATVATAVAPIGVYLFPPRNPDQRKQRIRVALDTPVAALREGAVSRFDAPAGTAFVMADGGGVNSPGDPTFGGFLTRDQGRLRALAITCPHLGCSYAFDDGKRHFVCPCHGSEFALDGAVLHGPATNPLSHLTWSAGPGASEIDVDGVSVGA